jgi:integrase/recombinase XerD
MATNDSIYLFPDKYGNPITVNSIQQYLRRLAQKAGLGDVKVTPHIFRHTAATHAAAQGTNAFILKEIMGHSSMQTTMKYIHLQPDDLKAQHNKFSMVNEIFKKTRYLNNHEMFTLHKGVESKLLLTTN